MGENSLSDKEIIEALSFEYNLNKKRARNDKFEITFNFGKCRVCKSDATGIHYGVSSCEGCKVIFLNVKTNNIHHFEGFFQTKLDQTPKLYLQKQQRLFHLSEAKKKMQILPLDGLYKRWNVFVRG